MPRAQNVASQPLDLIDGNATLIAAHVIYSTPSVHSDHPSSSQKGEEEAGSVCSAYPLHRNHSERSSNAAAGVEGEGASIYSADSDSRHGSVHSPEGLNLPLNAHMLPGRWKWHFAVLPVLMVADAHNIVPLLCSVLYQRRVWGVCEPVVGLCCSNVGTTATIIFGWLDSNWSEDSFMVF